MGGTPGAKPKRQYKAYLISSGDAVKIGKTSGKPEVRLKHLQTGSSEQLTLLLVIDGDCERQLHRRFKFLRKHREWYALTPGIRAFVKAVIASREKTQRVSK